MKKPLENEWYVIIKAISLQKRIVILTIIFLTRVATVDMVLWEDTKI